MRTSGETGRCRFCHAELTRTFVDLGMSPLCETYLARDELNRMEPFYPLHVYVCDACWLVQLEQYVSPEEIFSEYPYFSSYSDSWLHHARSYAETMVRRLGLGPHSLALELGSNDGYLLQYFMERGIPVLGVEPAANVAQTALDKGIPTRIEFFGEATARSLVAEGLRPDLIVGNNVLAQVPDLNDFVAGMKLLLAPTGTVTLEFPHLLRLVEGHQFDTIYHEHFSYFSLLAVNRILEAHGLVLFNVEELPTHGGSLRVYAGYAGDSAPPIDASVRDLRAREEQAGLRDPSYYESFGARVRQTKWRLVEFLIEARRAGKSIAGYGAPGKGNTLLNYCGIRTDLLEYTVDRNPYKQGRFLPGTHIPIHHPDRIAQTQPDFVLILPWNLKEEVIQQLSHVRDWGGRFIVPIPEVTVDR
jgi:C-methyltransferase C-terminal domain/Putative zinc binding domain/Methyltransferase domain